MDKIMRLKKKFFGIRDFSLNDDMPTIIKAIREILNLSQDELAQLLDVSFATINRLENGKNKPQAILKSKIEKIAKHLLKEMN